MRLTPFILLAFLSFNLFSQDKTTDCLNHVNGVVLSKQTGKVISNATIHLKQNGKIIREISADNQGEFSFDLDCDNRYQISAQLENYTKNIKLVFTSESMLNHNLKLELFPIKEFKKVNNENRIIIEPIEFTPNNFRITPKAASQLDLVYDLLEKYQHINIKIGFHSDIRGNAKFLLTLTQKRADACANYLVNKGIESSRVYAKGYGATQLLNRCKKNVNCTNTEHLENRRTEFIVIKDVELSLNLN